MELVLPPENGFGGLFSVGFRKHPIISGQTQRIGSLLLRRNYVLAGNILQPDTTVAKIQLGDELDADNHVTHESNLVPFKPEGDLIVLGFYSSHQGGSAHVDGDLWLRRAENSETDDDPDTKRNLFGFSPRSHSPRMDDAGSFSTDSANYPAQWPVQHPNRDPLPGDYSNRFNNAHRRGSWKQLGQFPYFHQAAEISIQHHSPQGSNTRRISLLNEQFKARYAYYCGHGPDRQSRWCHTNLPLTCDTVVLEPNVNRAYLLWRGVWDFDLHDSAVYRQLNVKLEV